MIKLMHGDCINEMKKLQEGSVDLILTDPPYGLMKNLNERVTHLRYDNGAWDTKIDTVKMINACNRLLRYGGVLVLFCQNSYTTELLMHQIHDLKVLYRAIWNKNSFANCLSANKAMVSMFEDILIFRKKCTIYDYDFKSSSRLYAEKIFNFIGKNKQQIFKIMGTQAADHFFRHDSTQFTICTAETYQKLINIFKINNMQGFKPYEEVLKEYEQNHNKNADKLKKLYPITFNLPEGKNYKGNILSYSKDTPSLHPTQKPVALLEDLIKTYSNEGDLVLDFCMGSGSTGVAAKNTNRNFIGIELEKKYFDIAKDRIHG